MNNRWNTGLQALTWIKRLSVRMGSVLALIASVSILSLLGACSEKPVSFNAIDITGADYAKNLTWVGAKGEPHQLSDFKGKVSLVFFGYTQCPDVCPTSMADMKAIKASLGELGPLVQVIFVSVDPERDTPEVLDAYVANFGADFWGVSPKLDELKALAKDFHVFYQKVDGPTPTSYTMEHTAGFYIYDTKSQLRLFARFGTSQEAMAADLKALLKKG